VLPEPTQRLIPPQPRQSNGHRTQQRARTTPIAPAGRREDAAPAQERPPITRRIRLS
jgi:hypothetical protein